MKRWLLAFGFLALAVYLSSGFYVVRGNEQAVVRRFGRVVRTADGNVSLRGSGLRFDLPWPFSRVDRVNLNEIRTLTIGIAEEDDFADTGFLQTLETARKSQFLTGDKNILNLQIGVQYRISEQGVDDYLFHSQAVDERLRLLVESIAADLTARSGVDFVHPLGLGELRELLTSQTRELADQERLGVEIEEVTINSIYPPVRVKSYFLDVANARADKEKYINAARAYAEQTLAESRAEERRLLDGAQIYRQQTVEAARGRADSFGRLVTQFREQEQQGIQDYAAARRMALRRTYLEVMEEILPRITGKVILESGEPVDITIFSESGR